MKGRSVDFRYNNKRSEYSKNRGTPGINLSSKIAGSEAARHTPARPCHAPTARMNDVIRWSLPALCAFLMTVRAAPVLSQETLPLSLPEAIRLAQARSPQVRGAAARVAGAEAKLRGAGVPANPILQLAQGAGKNTGGLDENVLLSQIVELGDKRHQRIVAARADRAAAFEDRNGTLLDLTLAVQTAYYEALRSEQDRKLAAEALTNAQAFAKAAETQYEAGDVARSNVVRSRIELSRAEQAYSAAETERDNRYAAVRSLTGTPKETVFTLTDTLAFTAEKRTLSDLQARAEASRPDLLAARQQKESRAALLRGVRAQMQPDLLLEARHSTLDPSNGGSSVRVGLVFSLFDLGRNRADTRVAQAAVQEQDAAIAELLRTVRLDVETAYRNLEQAQKVVVSFQSGRLERARELLEMAQLGYSRGAASFLELLDAQNTYRSEQTDYNRALAAYNTARATLQRAVGGTLP